MILYVVLFVKFNRMRKANARQIKKYQERFGEG
jgi:hypothetical protein